MILIWGYIIGIITVFFFNLAIYIQFLFTKDTRKHICGVKKRKGDQKYVCGKDLYSLHSKFGSEFPGSKKKKKKSQ